MKRFSAGRTTFIHVSAGTFPRPLTFLRRKPGEAIMRSCLLYMLGVPIPVIIIIWLLTGHA